MNKILLIVKRIADLDCFYTMSSGFLSLLPQDDERPAILEQMSVQ